MQQQPEFVRAEHRIDIPAPADRTYSLVADAALAPLVFPGTVHVEWLYRTVTRERIRIWAVNGDDRRRWISVRTLRPRKRTVRFQQEAPAPPISQMLGEWSVTPLSDTRSKVSLRHAYRAIDDDPADLAWIADLVERISVGQLRALARTAECSGPALVEDEFEVACPLTEAYALASAPLAASPASGSLSDLQVIDGPQRLARVCVPERRIAFKTLCPIAPVTAHIGYLELTPLADPFKTLVSLRELVMLERDATQAELTPVSLGESVAPGLIAMR